MADRVGAAPSALSIRFGSFDGLQRSLVAQPLLNVLLIATGGVVWLPHQHPAVAQVDGRDAALVCTVAVAVAAGVGTGGGTSAKAEVVNSVCFLSADG